jgi:hypothetical protein
LRLTCPQQESASFLKKEAKTFAYWCAPCGSVYFYNQKFFGSFFQKRTACFLPPGETRVRVNIKGGWYNTKRL